MRRAARVTLFLHDRTGRMAVDPDVAVLHLLLGQPPLIERHEDGSRTFVYDLAWPEAMLGREPSPSAASLERLRQALTELLAEAQALGLSRTAALVEATGHAALAEVGSTPRPHLDG